MPKDKPISTKAAKTGALLSAGAMLASAALPSTYAFAADEGATSAPDIEGSQQVPTASYPTHASLVETTDVEQAQTQLDAAKAEHEQVMEVYEAEKAKYEVAQAEVAEMAKTASDAEIVEAQAELAAKQAIVVELEAKAKKAEEAAAALEAAQEELAELVAAEEEAMKDAAEAKEALDAAQAAYDEISAQVGADGAQELLDAAQALEDAKVAYETAQTSEAEASAKLETAKTELAAAQASEAGAKATLDEANGKLASAEGDLSSAKAALDAAKDDLTAYDEIEDTDEYKAASAKVDAAQAAYDDAASRRDAAQAEIAKQELLIAELTESEKTANAELEAAQAELSAAEKSAADAAGNVASAQDTYDKALAESNATAEEAQKKAQEKAEAENELTEATAAKEAADKDVQDAVAARAAKQQEVDELQAAADAKVYDAWDFFADLSGGLGEDAIKVLDLAPKRDHMTKGDPNDATSLDNMLASIQWLKRCNELRAEQGLPALQVNYTLTAIAMVNANYSSDYVNSHSKQFNVGENLAWNRGTDPFIQWYDREKALYDDVVASGIEGGAGASSWVSSNWSSATTADRVALVQQMQKAITGTDITTAEASAYISAHYGNASSVGHYTNVIGSYFYTGFAISNYTHSGSPWPYTYAQEFTSAPMQAGYNKTLPEGLTFGTATANGNVSVDEYEQILTAYIEKVRADDPALTQAKADLQTAIKAYDDAVAAAADKDAALATAQAAYDQAYAAAEQAGADDAVAQQSKTDAKAALEAAQEEQGKAEAAAKDARDAVGAAQAEVAELGAQIENAVAAKAEAAGDLAQAEADLPVAQEALAQAQADRDNMFAGVADAEQAVMNAQDEYDRQLTIHEDAAAEQLAASNTHAAAQQLLEQLMLAANTAEAELSKASSDVTAAAEQVRLRQQAYDAKEIEFAELSKALADLDTATSNYNEKTTISNKAAANREAGGAKVTSTEDAAGAAASENEAAKQLLVWDDIKDSGTSGQYPEIDELVTALQAASVSYAQALAAHKTAQDAFAPIAAAFAVAQSHADASYANIAAAQGIYDEAVEWNTDYVILDGEGSKYEKGCGLGLRFRFSGPVDRFVELRVDGVLVDPAFYTIASGSTIATLSAEYMEGLAIGEHTVSALYANGDTADATFEVVPAAEKPSNGDSEEGNEENDKKPSGSDTTDGGNADTGDDTDESVTRSDSATAALVQTGDGATGILGITTGVALVSGAALLASAAGARRRR